MNKIIKWFKDRFGKLNKEKCDKILSNLNLPLFYGKIGYEVYYPDTITSLPIISILLNKNNILFNLSPDKTSFFENIGLIDLNKLERIYLYNKIEESMMDEREKYIKTMKETILAKYAISEYEFAFLVKHCLGN
jgi:hypothetical protein